MRRVLTLRAFCLRILSLTIMYGTEITRMNNEPEAIWDFPTPARVCGTLSDLTFSLDRVCIVFIQSLVLSPWMDQVAQQRAVRHLIACSCFPMCVHGVGSTYAGSVNCCYRVCWVVLRALVIQERCNPEILRHPERGWFETVAADETNALLIYCHGPRQS